MRSPPTRGAMPIFSGKKPADVLRHVKPSVPGLAGETEVGTRLAKALGGTFAEGDDDHPPAGRDAGVPQRASGAATMRRVPQQCVGRRINASGRRMNRRVGDAVAHGSEATLR